MDLQNKTIEMLIENEKLTEASNKKVLLYPSSEYSGRMDPANITDEKGILFGWFNDEDIDAYSTGYNTIQDLEKAVKNKEYMIDSFQDDQDFDGMTGDEWWNYIVKTIEDSYVDGDSYWSMFLIDVNNGYKILYCGSEEPNIEEVSLRKKKMNLKYYQFKEENKPAYPYFKLGKYELNCTKDNSDEIEISTEYFDKIYNEDEFYDEMYTLEEIEEHLEVDLLGLITDQQKLEFLEAYKKYLIYEETEKQKKQDELQRQKAATQIELSKKCNEEIKSEVIDLIYSNRNYLPKRDINALPVNFLHILNKCDFTNTEGRAHYIIEYICPDEEYMEAIEENFDIINKAIVNNTNINKAYQIIESIIRENHISEEFMKIYQDKDITYIDLINMYHFLDNDITPEQFYNIAKNPKFENIESIISLGLTQGLNEDQLNNLAELCNTLGEESCTWLKRYHDDDIIIDCFIPMLKKEIPIKDIALAYAKEDDADSIIATLKKLLKKGV